MAHQISVPSGSVMASTYCCALALSCSIARRWSIAQRGISAAALEATPTSTLTSIGSVWASVCSSVHGARCSGSQPRGIAAAPRPARPAIIGEFWAGAIFSRSAQLKVDTILHKNAIDAWQFFTTPWSFRCQPREQSEHKGREQAKPDGGGGGDARRPRRQAGSAGQGAQEHSVYLAARSTRRHTTLT